MMTPASQSSVHAEAAASDAALRTARMVMRAHAGVDAPEVSRELLAHLLAAVGASRGALAVSTHEPLGRRAAPRVLAVVGDDASLRLALVAESDLGHDDQPAGPHRDWVRFQIPLAVRDERPDAAGDEHAQPAIVLLAWEEPLALEDLIHARDHITALREPVAAVVLSVLAAERRVALERMADEHAAALVEARAARADWEQTFDAVSDPIAVIGADLKLLRVNAAYRRLFGLGAEQPVRHDCFAVHDGGTAPCPGCPLPRTLATGSPGYVEREELVATGRNHALERRLFHIWTYPVHDAAGRITHVVEIMKDVTEQERLRQLTTQAEALRAADHLKAELLGTVSHELRSPLAAIKGYASTLLRHERRLPRAERHEFLTAIGEASTRLEVIINHLLEMSQLETGDAIIERFPLDVGPIARDAIAGVRAATGAEARAPITFALNLLTLDGQPANHVPLILADPRAMREVLDNLLQNAVKYSPQGGDIRVTLRPTSSRALDVLDAIPDLPGPPRRPGARVPQASAQSAQQEDVLEVTVSDHGVGIPDEHLGRIFERFHRVDTRLTREVDGLGLGLAICRRIVELHDGAIWAESQSGAGSTFHVLLPIAPHEDRQEDMKEM